MMMTVSVERRGGGRRRFCWRVGAPPRIREVVKQKNDGRIDRVDAKIFFGGGD